MNVTRATKKGVIIIGAGIAGLSAGFNLQKNGYEIQIYKLSKRAGGLCTAWERKGYTMENCIHYLTGAIPPLNKGLYNHGARGGKKSCQP